MRFTPYPYTGALISANSQDVLNTVSTTTKMCLINRHYDPSQKISKLKLFLTKLAPLLSSSDQKIVESARKMVKELNAHILEQSKKAASLF